MRIDAGIGHCLGGGGPGEGSDPADMGTLLCVQPLRFVESGDLASDAHLMPGGVKLRNPTDTALSRHSVCPEFFTANSVRTQRADACNDDPPKAGPRMENRHECASIGLFRLYFSMDVELPYRKS